MGEQVIQCGYAQTLKTALEMIGPDILATANDVIIRSLPRNDIFESLVTGLHGEVDETKDINGVRYNGLIWEVRQDFDPRVESQKGLHVNVRLTSKRATRTSSKISTSYAFVDTSSLEFKRKVSTQSDPQLVSSELDDGRYMQDLLRFTHHVHWDPNSLDPASPQQKGKPVSGYSLQDVVAEAVGRWSAVAGW